MTSTRRLLVVVLETDTLAERFESTWVVPCIHCRSKLQVEDPPEPGSIATLEHIVPRSWFGHAAARDLIEALEGPNDPRNLAVACNRCNHSKGMGPDAKGPSDASARDVISRLLDTRRARFREPRE